MPQLPRLDAASGSLIAQLPNSSAALSEASNKPRPLRTAAHYRRAVGQDVAVKTRPEVEGERRVSGTVVAADDDTVTVRLAGGEERRFRHDEIEKARTTFAWGPAPKPGGARR